MAIEPFGGMFDFNGDGKTDSAEMGLGLFLLNEMSESERRGRDPFAPGDDDAADDDR